MTEIPAKTPRPIGNTSNLRPGTCCWASSAAAALGVETEVDTEPSDNVVMTVTGEGATFDARMAPVPYRFGVRI